MASFCMNRRQSQLICGLLQQGRYQTVADQIFLQAYIKLQHYKCIKSKVIFPYKVVRTFFL